MKKIKCDFCKFKGKWKNVLRSVHLEKKDGSDIIICNDCLNLYTNQEYDRLFKKIKKVTK